MNMNKIAGLVLTILVSLFAHSTTAVADETAQKPHVTKYVRFRIGETIAYGIVEGDQVHQLSGDLFGTWTKTQTTYPMDQVELLVPCCPSKVLALAGNYKSHIGDTPEPKHPEVFFKVPSCLLAHEQNIVIPPDTSDVHYEAEMVIVIGKRAKNVTPQEALQYVLGVTCGNDVSARDWQANDKQWWRAKGTDTFGPCGPIIASGLDYDNLLLQLRLNGQVKQRQRTNDMIHSVPQAVSWISRFVTLEPGDLIYTGTFGTTSPLKPGDVVEVELEGVGVLKNSVVAAQGPKIVSVQKIWDDAPHNAFTDLIHFQDAWFCTFREGEGHVGGNGKLRVLTSTDSNKWKSVALLAEDGVDLRDPKLSITPQQRLMLLAGGSVYEGKKFIGCQTRVTFSKDGHYWKPMQRILDENEWLWRVTWNKGRAYGVSRDKVGQKDPSQKITLVTSSDGLHYERITQLDVPDRPNETTLRFLPNGDMLALVRREAGNQHGWIGQSSFPYQEWTWHETEHRLGGPNFICFEDGSMWAASRNHLPQQRDTIALARFGPETYEPVLTLPSGGDCSCPGLAWYDDMLWMSYYSSHEGKSSIYLAKIRLSP